MRAPNTSPRATHKKVQTKKTQQKAQTTAKKSPL
jgi:hypothetical protein